VRNPLETPAASPFAVARYSSAGSNESDLAPSDSFPKEKRANRVAPASQAGVAKL